MLDLIEGKHECKNLFSFWVIPVNFRTPSLGRTTHQIKGPTFFMIKCAGKIQMLYLKGQECLEFSILQTIYPYIGTRPATGRYGFFQLFVTTLGFLHYSSCMFLDSGGFLCTSGFSLPQGGGGWGPG